MSLSEQHILFLTYVPIYPPISITIDVIFAYIANQVCSSIRQHTTVHAVIEQRRKLGDKGVAKTSLHKLAHGTFMAKISDVSCIFHKNILIGLRLVTAVRSLRHRSNRESERAELSNMLVSLSLSESG